MLLELAVSELGVIPELRLVLGPGLTVFTGETGAGKTLVVGALELLLGGRADATIVRHGAREATVEARILDGDREVVLTRVVPADGRSRAYVDGRLATAATLAETGARIVELHGQHAHQTLLEPAAQRDALDRFAGVDLGPRRVAADTVAGIRRRLAELGGDAHARARELDLLRFQIDELAAAAVSDPGEEKLLEEEEDRLANADAHRAAAASAYQRLRSEGGAADQVAAALADIADRAPLAPLHDRLAGVSAELDDLAAELRAAGDEIDTDPERLEAVRQRRQLLRGLCRKYGDDLAAVLAYADEAQERLQRLESHDAEVAELERELAEAVAALAEAAAATAAARQAAAPRLAADVEVRLGALGMAGASVECTVGGDGGDDVELLLAANVGEPRRPLAKVASGGELSRTMLAVRLVLGGAAPTLVFDEVDAGIGGEAGVAVGRALADLASRRQVLVVTHLAQVAAFADTQVAVRKAHEGGRTVSVAAVVDGDDRLAELARMLSGHPDRHAALDHAAQLLADARAGRR